MEDSEWAEDEGDYLVWTPQEIPFHHDKPMVEKGWINKRYECETCGFVIWA